MASKENRDQFETQLDVLRSLAARSTSAAVTSRWIAASDERVKELVFKKFADGLFLRGVTSFPSPGRSKYAVVFSFERTGATVNLLQNSFLVTVDLTTKAVADVIDPYLDDEGSAPGGGLPFAMRVPSNAPNVLVSREAGATYRAAEQEFFRRRGILTDPFRPVLPERPGRPGGFWPERPGFDFPPRGSWGIPSPAATYYKASTEVATDIGTDTPTGNPPEQSDDVENDGHADYETDLVPFD